MIVENDSTCAAIGEYWVGRLPSTEDFASVYMTDGFGLGLVIKGEIYRGASSNAGEIGHMTVDPNGLFARAVGVAACTRWAAWNGWWRWPRRTPR